MELTKIKGIGPKTEKLFNKLGVFTCEDLIRYYPVHYDAYMPPCSAGNVIVGAKCAVFGTIAKAVVVRPTGRVTISTTEIDDPTGRIRLTWYNAPYIRTVLKRGAVYVFRGTVSQKGGVKIMEHPEIFTPARYSEKLETLNPVYGLTKGLSNNAVSKAVKAAFELIGPEAEYLPEQICRMNDLTDESLAARTVHFPGNEKDLFAARKRIAFDEFFFFIMALRKMKDAEGDIPNGHPMKRCWATEDIIDNLPYRLTGAQMRVWQEIEDDLAGKKLMSRLVQGDVGSGKTIIAFLAMVMCAENGYQSALMAPTEVLARQHFEKFEKMCQSSGNEKLRPILLTGSLKAKEKREVQQKIRAGEANIIIGTHALIQEAVEYSDLALVITDEQHRFGVDQRKALAGGISPPHRMVMSATPIPRTLGVIYYGDLDISIIDELPARRLPIKNCVVDNSWRDKAMRFIKREVDAGHQAYIICPMIEASEGLDVENVIDYTKKLKKEFPEYGIAMLHGRMKPAEKNKIMEDFADRKIQILVSTTVVEVGVDVPNATVIMIENAERFGLAALHQLRGRVGRGDAQSYAIFMSGQESADIRQRLDILNRSNDGFEIAEKDFELRGPGDLLGIRQSGDALFDVADLLRDRDVLAKAGEIAAVIMHDDPAQISETYSVLRTRLNAYMSKESVNLIL